MPAAEFFDGVWSTALEDGELLRVDLASRCGAAGAGSASPSSPAATATSPSPAPSPPSSSAPDDVVGAQRAVPSFGVGRHAHAGAVDARRRSPAGRAPTIDADEVGRSAMDAIEDVSDDPQVPAAYRRRIGAAMVADAWRRAVDDAA